MELPQQLDDWTFETIVEIVRTAAFEPGRFDFKEVLRPEREEEKHFNEKICRTVGSMANSEEGYVLFGVKDRAQPVATSEDRIVGIPLHAELRKEFGDKLSMLRPEVSWDAIPAPLPLPHDGTRGVFVVRIPLSQRRPHMLWPTGVFYRRGDGGAAVIMDVYEVRDQMLLTEERLRKVTLLRLELAQYRQLVARLTALNLDVAESPLRFDSGAFKPILADICSLLPANDPLLSDLLQVPADAQAVNETLGFGTRTPRFLTGWPTGELRTKIRDIVQSHLSTLDERCGRCEESLASLFGSMPAQVSPPQT
jgi:hypothetical protein